VRHAGRVDGPDLVEREPAALDPVEQPGAGAEDQGCDREVNLVNQPRFQVLVDHGRPAGEPDVPFPGRILGLRKR
jgi:hypothetical protein